MEKLKLDTVAINDNFFAGTRLLGIISELKGYRFCWMLNADLKYDFRLNTEIEVQLKKKSRNYFFQVYQYCEQDGETEHLIYQNNYEGEFLLPEFKHFDFLWLIRADLIAEEEVAGLQQNLRSMNVVQLVAELATEKIKNKGNLIL